jgi:putative flippase GtrA
MAKLCLQMMPEGGSRLFVKFLLVGFINTLFGYGCFAIFLFMGMHYAIALFLATAVGIVFNFKTTGVLVFKSSNNRLIFRFVAVYLFAYCINLLGLRLLQLWEINPYYAGGVLVIPMALVTFFLNKRYVFDRVNNI